MPRHTLIMDQETRWSRTYTMLERFLLQKINYSDLHRIWKVWHSNTRKSWLGNFAKRCGVATSPVVLRWLCDSPRTGCARRTKIYSVFVARASNSKRDCEHDFYCCLLPRWEALLTCHSEFPIATKWCCDQDWDEERWVFLWSENIDKIFCEAKISTTQYGCKQGSLDQREQFCYCFCCASVLFFFLLHESESWPDLVHKKIEFRNRVS